MSRRGVVGAAAIVIASAVMGVATIVMGLTRGIDRPGVTAYEAANAIWTISQLGFVCVGILILLRARRRLVGVMFLLAGLLPLLGTFAYEYAYRGLLLVPGGLPGATGATVVYYLLNTAIGGWFALTVLTFPTASLPSARWRPVAAVAVSGIVVTVISSAVLASSAGPALLEEMPALKGAAGVFWDLPYLFLLPATFLAVASVVFRFRSSGDVERLQLKWFLYSVGLALLGIVVGPMSPGWLGPMGNVVASTGTLSVPLAVAMAMLKYRLYDIDVIINRSLVYAALTAVLVAAYAGGVLIFRTVLDPVTGENDLAIAASTLGVAALFGPARRRIQAFIDRRFYRSRYDAQQTLEAFAARLRNEVDLNAVSAQLTAAVADTMQPRHASVWLRAEEGMR